MVLVHKWVGTQNNTFTNCVNTGNFSCWLWPPTHFRTHTKNKIAEVSVQMQYSTVSVPYRGIYISNLYRIHKTYTVDRKRRRRFEDVPVIVVDPEVVVAKTDEDGCPVFLA